MLTPSCATIVGIDAIPDVDGGGEANVAADASDEAPEGSPTTESGADGPASADGSVDAGDGRLSDVVQQDAPGSCTAPGWGCVPAIPQGFAYELVDRNDTTACATGLTTSEVFASATGSPATCTCACGVGQEPSCTSGSLTANVGSMSCNEGTATYDASGACIGASGVSPTFLQAAAPAPAGGTCAPSVGKSVPQAQQTRWRTCGYAGPVGSGCPSGHVCAPVATGLSSCVAVAGNVACPASYPNASTVGTGVSDTRDCGVCTCAPPTAATCSSATLTFYVAAGCGSAVETVPVDLSCQQLAGSTYGSYRYAATPSESCGPVSQQPSATGGVSLTGTTTICCAP